MPRKKEIPNGQIDYDLAELFGGIKEKIANFTASRPISANEVAGWLAELLRAYSHGALLGHSPGVRDMRGTGDHHKSTTRRVAAVAVAKPASARSASGSSKARATGKVSPAKAYWDRMTPEQRSAEMARRRKKWSKEAKLRWLHKLPPKKKKVKEE